MSIWRESPIADKKYLIYPISNTMGGSQSTRKVTVDNENAIQMSQDALDRITAQLNSKVNMMLHYIIFINVTSHCSKINQWYLVNMRQPTSSYNIIQLLSSLHQYL